MQQKTFLSYRPDDLDAQVNEWFIANKVHIDSYTVMHALAVDKDNRVILSVAILYTLLPQTDTPIVFQGGGINEKDN